MTLSRRSILKGIAGASATFVFAGSNTFAQESLIEKIIPSSGKPLPAVGLGSWSTFNVGTDSRAIKRSTGVIDAFFKAGGRMIDSSPMYGSAQSVIGEAIGQLDAAQLFSTDKVWASGRADGVAQIEEFRRLWGVPKFSLVQVHLKILFGIKIRGICPYSFFQAM